MTEAARTRLERAAYRNGDTQPLRVPTQRRGNKQSNLPALSRPTAPLLADTPGSLRPCPSPTQSRIWGRGLSTPKVGPAALREPEGCAQLRGSSFGLDSTEGPEQVGQGHRVTGSLALCLLAPRQRSHLCTHGLSRLFSSTTAQEHRFLGAQPSFWSNSHICTRLLEKPQL